MKSLNIKIPLAKAQRLDDNGQLNPDHLTGLIVANLHQAGNLSTAVEGLTYNYTFKVPADLHHCIKLKALEMGLNMNELIARLIDQFYEG